VHTKKTGSFFTVFLRFLLGLALFSKFEIFKTFLNNKISNLCLWNYFFYSNRKDFKIFAHTRKTQKFSHVSKSSEGWTIEIKK
jgi:hypothetical protein